jgi:hypothetical protein
MEGEQAPVQVGQFILAKNLGIGAFGKVGAAIGGRTVCTVCVCVGSFLYARSRRT